MNNIIKHLKLLAFISLFLLNSTCQKEKTSFRPYPRVQTNAVSNINSSGATFNAEIVNSENLTILMHGFVWGESEDPSIEDSEKKVLGENIVSGSYSAEISTTLKVNKIYFVRAFVKTEKYIVYGKNVSFLSLGSKDNTTN